MKRFLLLLSFLLFPHLVGAQVVAQGSPTDTTDAAAWPVKIVFGDTQIDPRTQQGVWTFRLFDKDGNGITSTSNALDVNVKNALTVGVTGNVTVVQPTGTNLHTVCDSGCGTATLSSSATETNVAVGNANVTLLASNASRKGASVFWDVSFSGCILRIKLGATASATSFTTMLFLNGYWVLPVNGYTGQIDAIASSAACGNARITEW